ncbi:unnamed protein product [Triticum turgidum subsp. durum]|uniref:Glycosyltransferase n=1 Tax=Triticum turgidum subsp. durum TaxID=4567 RepID=A0A9R1PDJ9_TRITD|nr:unnamed protein product [Triticum turgidum subsp. durum]
MEADYMELKWCAKTVGPTLPSFYLDDDRLPSNKTYGFNLVSSTSPCVAWLNKQAPCSVLLASYGTVANLDSTQLEELGHGLCNSGQPFLWVLRPSETDKLTQELHDKCNMKGQIVPFCPQLDVLAHRAKVVS